MKQCKDNIMSNNFTVMIYTSKDIFNQIKKFTYHCVLRNTFRIDQDMQHMDPKNVKYKSK